MLTKNYSMTITTIPALLTTKPERKIAKRLLM